MQTLDLKSRQLAVTRFGDFTYDLAGLIARQGPEPRKVEELTTSELFAATPALLEETGATRARFLSDAHSRFGQPLLATVAAMIGFATLLLGAFSRFGLWRQILASIGLLLVVQGISTVATAQSELSESGWVLAYLPGAVGAAITAAMLWYGQRERRRPAVLA